jgi:hypothetical protein
MLKVIVILGLIVVVLCSGSMFILSLAADGAITAVADYASRPESVSDVVGQSYERRSVQAGGNRELAGAGMLALFLLFIGSILAFMWRGQLLTRELRLALRRRHQRPFNPLPPTLPTLPTQPPENAPTLRQLPTVPRLPAWTETDYEER